MIRIAILATAALAGCASVPQRGAGRCDASTVKMFVGALGTSDVGKTMLRRAKARSIRWLAPGTMATMDYRTDRLNVRIDGRNYITGVDCG